MTSSQAAKILASGYGTTEEKVQVVTAAAKPRNRIHDSLLGEECSCSVLYFTSGDVFNKNVRIHTVEMGFTINMPASHPLGVTGQFTPLCRAMLGRPFP
ncbi:DNA polymerase beta-like isoform X2 [Calonectris borealis]|uniref:DNA polymerase beta-like isoform X2 n=1 Tax=Calonectris borealis TaxID=1323832 RepID=UPI003F4B4533